MRIKVLQHTPNEGPGYFKDWADVYGHEMYIYHPYQFGKLPQASETDFLIILGGPMSPNDDLDWIVKERELIKELMKDNKPIFGVCYGAQQISKALGYKVNKAPYKEVGFAPVFLKSERINNIPETLNVLHWHEEMFQIPNEAELLFSSELVENQGFILGRNVIGLQFHLETKQSNLIEIAINDTEYPKTNNALGQLSDQIIQTNIPNENRDIMFTLLDYLIENTDRS